MTLHQLVSVHQAYLEDLHTESRSGFGRALSASISMPSTDSDAALSDLKTLVRIEGISEAGEDTAVKLATATRLLTAAQTNLSRLQKLQRDRRGDLRNAVALEKDFAQANEAVVEAERQHTGLVSTVARAVIRITMIEDYRAPLQAISLENFSSLEIVSWRELARYSPRSRSFLAPYLNSACHCFSGSLCSSFRAVSPGADFVTPLHPFPQLTD